MKKFALDVFAEIGSLIDFLAANPRDSAISAVSGLTLGLTIGGIIAAVAWGIRWIHHAV